MTKLLYVDRTSAAPITNKINLTRNLPMFCVCTVEPLTYPSRLIFGKETHRNTVHH